jgi:hypothetical protein
MRHSKPFGAIDAGIVIAGLSLLSQMFQRGQAGYHQLERQGSHAFKLGQEGYHRLEKQGSEALRRGQEGYHRLEKQGLAPPAWALPLIGIGAAAATIAAINPDRIVPRAIKWVKQQFGVTTPTRRRTKALKRARTAPKTRAKAASARAKMNHVAASASGKRARKTQAESRR